MKRGKKYQDAVKAYDRAAQYDVADAIDIVKKNATAKFDETIELHLMLKFIALFLYNLISS